MIKRLLVALDGSDHAGKALELACEVANRFDAELIALHVIPDKPLSKAERRLAEVEFHAPVDESFDIMRFADARDDPQLMSRHLAEQAAETGTPVPLCVRRAAHRRRHRAGHGQGCSQGSYGFARG